MKRKLLKVILAVFLLSGMTSVGAEEKNEKKKTDIVSQAAGLAGDAVKKNAEVSKELDTNDKMLSFAFVNIMYAVFAMQFFLMFLIVAIMLNNKKASRKAVLESLEVIFGSEGKDLKQLFADMNFIKESMIKFNSVTSHYVDDFKLLQNILELEKNIQEGLSRVASEINKDMALQIIGMTEGIKKEMVVQNTEAKNLFDIWKNYEADLSRSFGKLIDNFQATIATMLADGQTDIKESIAELMHGVVQTLSENNKNIIVSIEEAREAVDMIGKNNDTVMKSLQKIHDLEELIKLGKEFDKDEIFEYTYAMAVVSILNVLAIVVGAVAYPANELENAKDILYEQLGTIVEKCVTDSRNSIDKINFDKATVMLLEKESDVIIKEAKNKLKKHLDEYFDLPEEKKTEIERMKMIRMLVKQSQNYSAAAAGTFRKILK